MSSTFIQVVKAGIVVVLAYALSFDCTLQVDPVVYNMLHEDPGNVSYSAVGGLSDQIRELRESIELPLMNPELFIRVGIKPPKVTRQGHYSKAIIPLLDFSNNSCAFLRVYFFMGLLEPAKHCWPEQLPVILMPIS